MFHLHDRTRRKVVLAGFVLICVLPTCAVAGYCLWRNSSWGKRLAAEQLQQQLGWTVKLERLRHPRPGTEVYENLELLDPETGRTIFACRAVTVATRPMPDSRRIEKPMRVFEFEQPEIDAAAIPLIHQLLERALQDHIAPGMSLYITSDELKIRRGEAVQSYAKVDGCVDHLADMVCAALRFHPSDASAPPITVGLTRDRTTDPPCSRFEADVAEYEIPREMLALVKGATTK